MTKNRMATLLLALLVTASCGPRDVAGSCFYDEDCATGTCYTESEPGYCTAVCETEGSTSECPADTVCKRIEGGDPRCILVCEDDEDCPTNSDCNNVPDADVNGCEPVR